MSDERRERFRHMTPDLCRSARKALGLKHAGLAIEIGSRPAEVMRYELGKPVDDALVEKLRAYFTGQNIAVIVTKTETRVCRTNPYRATWDDPSDPEPGRDAAGPEGSGSSQG